MSASENSIEAEATEELRDILYKISEQMESIISALQKNSNSHESIRELFRLFHTLKAISSYLGLKNITKVASVVEDVLSILRQKKEPVRDEIIEWLHVLTDKVSVWSKNAQDYRFEFEPVDLYTLNMVKTSVVLPKKAEDILSGVNIFYLDNDAERSSAVHKLARQLMPTLIVMKTANDILKRVEVLPNCIVVINIKSTGVNMLQFIDKLVDEFNLPVMIVSDSKISDDTKGLIRRHGVEFFLDNFLSENALLNRLLNISKVYFEVKGIKVLNHPLQKKIASLKPLSSTATEINRLRANPDTSIKDVSDVISKDPIVSAKILKIANSPFSGIKGNIPSIHHAISMLGKDQVMGMVMQCEMDKFVKLNLSPYMISESDFFAISCKRMNLATHWYSKVSVAKAGMMATVALLASLGQIIISEEVLKLKYESKFAQLITNTASPLFAEMELFATSSEDVTADILTQWSVDDTIVNLLHCVNDITMASKDLRQEAIAMNVIFSTIPSIPTRICSDKVEEMKSFLAEMNFNPAYYEKAVKRVQDDCEL